MIERLPDVRRPGAIEKACAIPYRRRGSHVEVLVFEHPLAGHQLVKGTIEPDETPAAAARRELMEESGLALATPALPLGSTIIGNPAATWHFYAFRTDALPDRWQHRTADGGGLLFTFFWHPLRRVPDERWHAIFRAALAHVRDALPAATLD